MSFENIGDNLSQFKRDSIKIKSSPPGPSNIKNYESLNPESNPQNRFAQSKIYQPQMPKTMGVKMRVDNFSNLQKVN